MISKYTETDTSQSSLTKDESGDDTSRETSFLQLPLELRQKVYRELLGPDVTGGFQTSILRVSKGIHEEALDIFYGENGFIMYHVHRKFLGQLRPDPQSDRDFFSHSNLYPVTRADGRIGFEPALTVIIAPQQSCSSESDSQWQADWEKYVAFPISLPGFCTTLTMCNVRSSLHLRLSVPSVEYRTLVGRLDCLLDYFQECRGVGTAEILSAGGLPVETDLSSLMAKPLEHFDEILTRARCHQHRARQLAGRRPSEAMRTLATADYFFDWWSVHGSELSNETVKKWNDFWDMRLETSLAYAFQSLRYGEPKKAREVIHRIWGSTRPLKPESAPVPRRFWDKESECHYVLGLCSLFEDCKICALYEFLHALISKPGNKSVDQMIDKLEAAIENSDIPDDEIVRWNIKYVLGRFRHQPLLDPNLNADDHRHRGPAGMTADDLYKLEDGFAQSFTHLGGCKLVRYDRR